MRDETVRLIAAQRADLLAALANVSGAAWELPTACAPWTVKDVLAHLVEGEINLGRVYRGEVRETGYVDPNEGVAKWRALPGEAVRAALWQPHGFASQRVLEALSDDAWNQPIRAFGCRTISQLARLHLFELAMHGRDLTDALGMPTVWGPALPFLAEFVVRAAPKTLARRGVEPRAAVSVVAGEVAATLAGGPDGWTLTREANAPTVLTLDPEDLVLVTTGRAAVEATLERAKVDGSREEAAWLLSGWQVVAEG